MDLSKLADLYFNGQVAAQYLPDILRGAVVTLQLAFAIVIFGIILGLALAIVRLSSPRFIREIIRLWVDCLRALPPLAIILLLYFGMPTVGVNMPTFLVMWLTLGCVLAAFAEEIFWAGIAATNKGQWEAARSTGMTHWQTLTWVILPQSLRMCIPPLTNRTIAITKYTALGTAIGMPEMLNEGMTAQSFSGNATPLMMATLGYLIIFAPLMALASHLEKRMTWGARR